MTGFVLLRARAHRLLLAAALLTVLLTTAVPTTLTAYSGAIGDAALRHSLADPGNAVDTAMIVKADTPSANRRAAADRAVREGARRTFDGMPVTVRTLQRSGPYALPRSLQPPAARSGNPDLTHFAALDRTQVRFTEGRPPRGVGSGGSSGGGSRIEVALPQTAAEPLGLRPGARLTLTDRFRGPDVRVLITGLYRPERITAPYWQVDDLRGRGVHKLSFTTYGPLLTDPSVLLGDQVSSGESAWLVSADFSTLTTDRIGALRQAARDGTAALRKSDALSGTTAATTSLPEILDDVERSLLVSRSTLLIVALLLGLLSAYALFLVARLLSAERAGETRLLRARGGSPRRIAGLAALEALLLAVPAAICAPLLAGPLTRLLAEQGALARIGLRLDSSGARAEVWLVAAAVSLGCALAVAAPTLTSGAFTVRRARALPAPVRAGADVGLLLVAGVAYWQLDRRSTGALSAVGTGDGTGALGIDPLLVTAPALALLAGTVLTLRLLPLVARLAERRAAAGRGLPSALAGWQFSRRPSRGAGAVLLLVLTVALGMLAIGEGASWNRSQDDQADFRAGTDVRVVTSSASGLGGSGRYAAVDGVRSSAPAVRTTLPLSGDRTATVLALDTASAADGLLLRRDLAAEPVRPLLADLPPKGKTAGARLPTGATELRLALRLRSDRGDNEADTGGGGDDAAGTDEGGESTTADVTVTLQDRRDVPYRLPVGRLAADGRLHFLTLDLARAAEAPTGRAAEPLTLTDVRLTMEQPVGSPEQHRLSLEKVSAVPADGPEGPLPLPTSWTLTARSDSLSPAPDDSTLPTTPHREESPPGSLTVRYGTGYVPRDFSSQPETFTVRLRVTQPSASEVTGIATDRFLASAGLSGTGQRMDVAFGDAKVPVRIVRSVRALPTTEEDDDSDGGALLVDLRSVNRVLDARDKDIAQPTEWWLRTEPGAAARVASQVRARPDVEPSQVVVRDEIAEQLRDDPFGAGPEAAFAAAAVVAAALAAVGFAVSTAGSLRERTDEFAVLRALGTPRRQLARLIAAEQGVLVALSLTVGVALGTVLTRAVIPLIVLTPQATRPLPEVLVKLPVSPVVLLLAAVTVAPLAVTAVLAARRPDAAGTLRHQGGE
ncbi:ABC transporter permease [Streptomyces sp. NPDC046862]|uniref:ABC transporter permease n=1 Tax=Streptomyces sp. NPDC046862 TaxID=3154603 RepID=UPI003454E014